MSYEEEKVAKAGQVLRQERGEHHQAKDDKEKQDQRAAPPRIEQAAYSLARALGCCTHDPASSQTFARITFIPCPSFKWVF